MPSKRSAVNSTDKREPLNIVSKSYVVRARFQEVERWQLEWKWEGPSKRLY